MNRNTEEKYKNVDLLKNQTALISGGGGLLGVQFAQTLVNAGANVIIFDVAPQKKLNEICSRISESANGQCMGMHIDITKEKKVVSAVNTVNKKFGSIDILINAAALNPVPGSTSSKLQFSPYEKYPISLWEQEIKIGLTGVMTLTKTVAEHMIKRRHGSIINISSTYGITAPDNRIYESGLYKSIGYATVKSALINFTKSWASYLGEYGVRVNALVPGGVFAGQPKKFVKKYAERTMLGRMAEANEYNGAILFLASEASSYMTGSILTIDGGWSAW